jgi:cytochrome c-type biogenesis protein CcmH/NrfF
VSSSRREFVRELLSSVVPLAALGGMMQDGATRLPGQSRDTLLSQRPQGGVAPDTLAFPLNNPGRSVGPLDNDAGVIAVERQLRCVCGCTLDVYTCRTTDFSCTYSPAMHAKVVEQVQRNATSQEIIDWFLAQPDSVFGHKVMLMAPEAKGFNVMGYIVPGFTVAAVGLGLVAWLTRNRGDRAPVAVLPPTAPPADDATLARLQRALDDVES